MLRWRRLWCCTPGRALPRVLPRGGSGRYAFQPLALGAVATSLAATSALGARRGAGCQATAPPLQGKRDPYGGIILDPAGLPADPVAFQAHLDRSLVAWRAEGVRGVWLKVPLERAHLIGDAVSRGFIFHHAEKDYCMLTHWLPTDEPSPLPANASHQVGVGALVVNERGEVLLVQEGVGPLRGRDVWKIPTGILNAREDFKDAVERECFEETGVPATFEKVIAIRHAHHAPFGKSDLFFVCLLRAKSSCPFKIQASELAKAKWGDFKEFLQQAPYPRDTPVWREFYRACIGEDGVVGNVPGLQMQHLHQRADPTSSRNWIYY